MTRTSRTTLGSSHDIEDSLTCKATAQAGSNNLSDPYCHAPCRFHPSSCKTCKLHVFPIRHHLYHELQHTMMRSGFFVVVSDYLGGLKRAMLKFKSAILFLVDWCPFSLTSLLLYSSRCFVCEFLKTLTFRSDGFVSLPLAGLLFSYRLNTDSHAVFQREIPHGMFLVDQKGGVGIDSYWLAWPWLWLDSRVE